MHFALTAVVAIILLYFCSKAIRFIYGYIYIRFVFTSPILFKHEMLDPELFINEIVKTPTKYIRVCIGPHLTTIVTDPDVIGEAINKLPKEGYNAIKPWLGNSILTSKGELWKRNRKLLTEAFHFKALRKYTLIQNQLCKGFIEMLLEKLLQCEYLDLCDHVKLLTFEIAINSICSQDISVIREDALQYFHSVLQIAELLLKRFTNPFLIFSDTIYHNTREGKDFLNCCKKSRDFIQLLINQRRKEKKEQMEYYDMLELVTQCRDEHGKGLTDKEIIDELSTFLFAGIDTTSSLSVSIMYCLAKNSDLQQKCRDEVNKVLGDRDYVEYEDHAKLSYVTQFIKETARIYSPIFDITREITNDSYIDGKYFPFKSKITIGIQLVHMNPTIWKDPLLFNPDRFSPENMNLRHPYAFIPFSAGTRNCIGQNFAMNSLRVFTSKMVSNFEIFLKDADYTYVRTYPITLWPKNGLPLCLKKMT